MVQTTDGFNHNQSSFIEPMTSNTDRRSIEIRNENERYQKSSMDSPQPALNISKAKLNYKPSIRITRNTNRKSNKDSTDLMADACNNDFKSMERVKEHFDTTRYPISVD